MSAGAQALEQERDSMSEQLARVSVQKSKQDAELLRLRDLADEVLALRKQVCSSSSMSFFLFLFSFLCLFFFMVRARSARWSASL